MRSPCLDTLIRQAERQGSIVGQRVSAWEDARPEENYFPGQPIPCHAIRAHRQVHQLENLGHHEGRQRAGESPAAVKALTDDTRQMAAGTILISLRPPSAGRSREHAASNCPLCQHCIGWHTSDAVHAVSECSAALPLDAQVGTLRGFDVFVNMVLEDVEEYEEGPEGLRVTRMDTILLNGNNIAVLVPGGKPEPDMEQ